MSASGQKLPRQLMEVASALAPKADTVSGYRRVRFGPKPAVGSCNNKCRHKQTYSITSPASARSIGGTVNPNVFAVLRLITKSNLVGCNIGRSAGFSPLRIRPT